MISSEVAKKTVFWRVELDGSNQLLKGTEIEENASLFNIIPKGDPTHPSTFHIVHYDPNKTPLLHYLSTDTDGFGKSNGFLSLKPSVEVTRACFSIHSRLYGRSWFPGSKRTSSFEDLCNWLDARGEQFFISCSYHPLFNVNGYLAAEEESLPGEDDSAGKDRSTVKNISSAMKRISSVGKYISTVKDIVYSSSAKNDSSAVKKDSSAVKGDSSTLKKDKSAIKNISKSSNTYNITVLFSVPEEDQTRMLFQLHKKIPPEPPPLDVLTTAEPLPSDVLTTAEPPTSDVLTTAEPPPSDVLTTAEPPPSDVLTTAEPPPIDVATTAEQSLAVSGEVSPNTNTLIPTHASRSPLKPLLIPAIITGLGILYLYAVFGSK